MHFIIIFWKLLYDARKWNGHFEEWKIGDDTFNILIQIIDCYAIIIMDGRLARE